MRKRHLIRFGFNMALFAFGFYASHFLTEWMK